MLTPLPARVLLVDRQPVFRHGLRTVVTSHPYLTCAGEAGTLSAALKLFHFHSPELVIVEAELPGLATPTLIQTFLAARPKTLLAVLSADSAAKQVLVAIQGGARAWLPRTCSQEELSQALSELVHGKSYLHPSVSHILLQEFRSGRKDQAPAVSLSPRQRQILKLLCEGAEPHEIAQRLFVSVFTVKTHLRQLYRKFEVSGRVQLVSRALRNESHFRS